MAGDGRRKEREFSDDVRQQELEHAGEHCRMCGGRSLGAMYEYCHIYSNSTLQEWRRQGTDDHKWYDDGYVSSWANCLVLCKNCHECINFHGGRERCSVDYLESLKSDSTHCTALIRAGTLYRRCKKIRQSNSYRCRFHSDGGAEQLHESDGCVIV
jgi:hypothetical protein